MSKCLVSHSLILTIALGFFVGLAGPVKAANVTVNVDYTSPRQTLEGFGASVTWVANDLDSFSAAKQTQILDLLYDTSKPGAGLSWVRVGSFLCNYNPSPGVYDWNYWGIQSGMRWLQRVNDLTGTNPPATVTPYRTSASENQVQLSAISVSAGAFTITVPVKSVITVVG